MKAAIFDVDGTLLTGRRSSEALFARHLLAVGAIGARQALAAGWFTLVNGPRYGRHVFRKNKAYLSGLELGEVAVVARRFVERELATLIDRRLLQRMDEHRRAGEIVLLLTGTPDFLAGPLAGQVGADGWLGARYALSGRRFAAAAPTFHPLGDGKVVAAAELCARHGASLDDAAAYADSIDDLALLARVARPVAVRPDRRLSGEALARGWEIIDQAGADDADRASGRTRTA
ncbi:MAG: haloacid dehalogenase-like hydrolase [Rhodospirillales bacterium]|nr:MAG: haloacid dehalogenase-like hydrolase [Rhodospirillales bacterium]